MVIRFTKNTPTHHTFYIRRSDGTEESASLETRSFMPHDLIHFAYESEAGCRQSFYGRLAAGTRIDSLSGMDALNAATPADAELMETERITGPLTSFLRGGMSAGDFMHALENMFTALQQPLPAHISPAFLTHLQARYHALIGQWQALPHHTPMELHWQD